MNEAGEGLAVLQTSKMSYQDYAEAVVSLKSAPKYIEAFHLKALLPVFPGMVAGKAGDIWQQLDIILVPYYLLSVQKGTGFRVSLNCMTFCRCSHLGENVAEILQSLLVISL